MDYESFTKLLKTANWPKSTDAPKTTDYPIPNELLFDISKTLPERDSVANLHMQGITDLMRQAALRDHLIEGAPESEINSLNSIAELLRNADVGKTYNELPNSESANTFLQALIRYGVVNPDGSFTKAHSSYPRNFPNPNTVEHAVANYPGY